MANEYFADKEKDNLVLEEERLARSLDPLRKKRAQVDKTHAASTSHTPAKVEQQKPVQKTPSSETHKSNWRENEERKRVEEERRREEEELRKQEALARLKLEAEQPAAHVDTPVHPEITIESGPKPIEFDEDYKKKFYTSDADQKEAEAERARREEARLNKTVTPRQYQVDEKKIKQKEDEDEVARRTQAKVEARLRMAEAKRAHEEKLKQEAAELKRQQDEEDKKRIAASNLSKLLNI